MPAFTCYKLHTTIGGQAAELDDFVDFENQHPDVFGPEETDDFIAKLYVSIGIQHPTGWGSFVRSGFADMPDLPFGASVGAAIILKLKPENQSFAFTFGGTGRFLLKQEAWERGYGLLAALNLIYPRSGAGGTGRLVAVDAKRRAGDVIRSRRQASRALIFEAFEVDKIRDMVGGATGKPEDASWGRRITGADALHFEAERDFTSLGKLCRDLAAAHDRDDYRDRFAWLDAIRPIHDPATLADLDGHMLERLRSGDITDLDLTPPEIIDWSAVAGFRYHFDAYKKFNRPELRLQDYLRGLWGAEDDPSIVDVDYLRRRYVRAINAANREIYKWSIWRCLSGEFAIGDTIYVIDEGEIFAVASDFLEDLEKFISGIPVLTDVAWPKATPSTDEADFNKAATTSLSPAILMDKQTIRCRTQTTPIEVCDVLTANHRLVHVKRHLGSRDLSHLFSQGFVSARLLQEDLVFRNATSQKITELGGDVSFAFFDVSPLPTSEFEIVYVILARWRGRTFAKALPFFSKVNLERTVRELINRGFKVALSQVDTG